EDQRLAFKWYEKAAQAGEPDAMLYVSELYEMGDGVKQSDAKAAYWFAKYEEIMGDEDFDDEE
ncbi:MAG: sel1 repeat family protein, partial [Lachnospiraceae bacterium]|nr:sel1 repeat family protein [Lachnospiraceae bacterium]